MTSRHGMRGARQRRLDHEAAGLIESVGPDVTDLVPGDFVVLNWRAVCGECRSCKRGRPQYCFATHNATQKMTLDGQALSPALGIGAFAEKTLVAAGQATKVEDEGDINVTGDEKCTLTTYASNEAAWMWTYASRILTYAAKCDAPMTDDNTVSDTISAFDGQANGAAPTKGLVTTASRWNGERTTPRAYQAVTTTEYE